MYELTVSNAGNGQTTTRYSNLATAILVGSNMDGSEPRYWFWSISKNGEYFLSSGMGYDSILYMLGLEGVDKKGAYFAAKEHEKAHIARFGEDTFEN